MLYLQFDCSSGYLTSEQRNEKVKYLVQPENKRYQFRLRTAAMFNFENYLKQQSQAFKIRKRKQLRRKFESY